MSEISVSVVGSSSINPTVGNGDVVNVTFSAAGERGPRGDTGSAGPANKLTIGTVVTGTDAAATLSAQVVANGTATQTLSLTLPQGATGERGLQGDAGPTGPASSLSVGTVTTGDTPSATITGTAPNQVLSLTLPKGDAGATGAAGPYTTIQTGTTTTGSPGTAAKVDTVTSGNTVTLNFTVPRGVDGTANLGDETPQPLGVASAGTAGSAARADHVHATPVVSYANLTNVPLTFAPAAHSHAIGDVTNLQAVLDAKQAAGSYATLVGGTVPSSQLPGFVDDVIEQNNLAAFPATGEVGKLYVARDTNKVYRWSGSTYIEIASSPGSTDSVTEGTTNLYFTTLRASAAAPVQSVNGKVGDVLIEAGGIAWSTAPATTTTTTKAGSISYDDNFLYVANATNQWRRTSIEDWTTPTITISVQPSDQTAVGGTATFAVTATASQNAELTYQWQRQAGGAGAWTNIGTGLSATLDLADLAYATNNADKYRVIISSGAAGTGGTAVNGWLPAVVVELTPTATITSDSATLTVSAAISIVTQPQNVTLTSGTSASFAVSATTPGTGLAYQWQSSPDGTNWTNISGATTATYALTGITETANDNYRYRCVVSSSGYDDATSNAALLDVAPITVTSQPANKTGTPVAGTTPNYAATFTSAATSPAGSPTTQWEVSTDGGTTYSDVSGQTNTSLSLTSLTNSDSGKKYRAKFEKTGWNTVRSSAATLTVPLDAITVTQQPSNVTASISQYSTTSYTLPSGTWLGVSFANGKWFATPNDTLGGDYIATSDNGVTWTKRIAVLPSPGTWSNVVYYGGKYITLKEQTTSYAVSTDGINWSLGSLGNVTPPYRRNGVALYTFGVSAAGFTLLPAAGVYESGDGYVLYDSQNTLTSSNGIDWAAPSFSLLSHQLVPTTSRLATASVAVVYSNGTRVVAVSNLLGTYTGSSGWAFGTIDGSGITLSSFVDFTRPSGALPLLKFAAAASSTAVVGFAINEYFVNYANLDGSVRGTASFGSPLTAVASNGTNFAAMSAAGIASSTNGQSWVLRQSLPSGYTGRIASAGGAYVAWGTFGIYTSADALTWTQRSATSTNTNFADGPAIAGNAVVIPQQTITPGGVLSASFASAATTTFGSPAIQWQRSTDNGATWSNVSGAIASPYAFRPASGDNGAKYRAVFTKDSYTTVNSNAATLTVP